jgi:predicted amidophosphoribosyltransferase
MNKKVLRNLYIKKKLTFSQIGIKLNCCIQTVSNYLDKFKIPKRPHKYVRRFCADCGKEISYYRTRCKKCAKQGELHSQFLHHITKEKLIDLYLNKKLTITALAKKFLCSVPTIEERMLRFKIQRRTPNARIIKLCIDCGKRINYDHIRCHPCASKFNSGKNNFMFGKPSLHGYKIRYNKKWFRSSYEVNFAKFLDLSNIEWEYENKTFNLGNTTYTPDFYLPEFDCWIEIKGWWRDKAKQKVKKFRKIYPKINYRIYFKKDLQELGIIK